MSAPAAAPDLESGLAAPAQGNSNGTSGRFGSQQPQEGIRQPRPSSSGSTNAEGDDELILTPAKLRLDSRVLCSYATAVWLGHAIFCGLLLAQVMPACLIESSAFDCLAFVRLAAAPANIRLLSHRWRA